ncbi:hypothetical protein FRC12_022540 [Ceratobasidium sp. 428]|nr:hypothetical protein FRC12_022540 [Ceratobasidium sp. 428]
MASGADFIRVVLLSSIGKETFGQKVRLIARTVFTEANSPLIWIEDSGRYALADITVILGSDNSALELFRQPRCHVMITGYVEEPEIQERLPMGASIPKSKVSSPFVIRVVLLQSVPDIDTSAWRKAILARQELAERARQPKIAQQ